MKKHFIVLATLLTAGAYSLKAQDDKLISIGIKAGANFHTMVGDGSTGKKLDNDYKVGFTAGLFADMFISDGFYLQPGLFYTSKGTADKIDDKNKGSIVTNYLEIPVNFVFKPTLGAGNLIFSAGPYVGYALNGKVEQTADGTTQKLNTSFKSKLTGEDLAKVLLGQEVFMKRLDVGANLSVGYELKSGFGIQIYAQRGFVKLNPGIPEGINYKAKFFNQGAGATLSYRF